MNDLPNPWDDMAHIFRAMDRGTKRSKLRISAVVCPKDHTLVEVYRGVSGTLWGIFPTNRPDSGNSLSGKEWRAANLSTASHQRPGKTRLTIYALWCRCPDEYFSLFIEDIRASVENGKRRIRVDYLQLNADSQKTLNEAGSPHEYLLGTRIRVVA